MPPENFEQPEHPRLPQANAADRRPAERVRWGGSACRSLSDQLLVAIMGTDPEPDQALGALPRERADAETDTSRPEIPDLLESQRRMARISLEHREALVSQVAGFRR